MTKPPDDLLLLETFWEDHGGRSLGIVGDKKHQEKGTSYHLGKSRLTADAYSRKLERDRGKFLTEDASALDLGKLNKRIGKLRKFSNWLVKQAKAGKTPDIREIIWSPDGLEVRRWDDHQDRVIVSLRRPKGGKPKVIHDGQGDATHYRHTHISFYRDSRKTSKVAYFEPFFVKPIPDLTPDEALEPDPDDDLDLNLDDRIDPLPDDDHEGLTVRVKRSPHPRSTLSGIAREFDMTVKELLLFPQNEGFRANPGQVKAGDKVRVK